MVYVAFVIDAYSRRILGWRAATSMRTELVLDALEHAVWTRAQQGRPDLDGLIMHTDAGSQYTSIAHTERLALAGAAPSVGTVGDAYDIRSAQGQAEVWRRVERYGASATGSLLETVGGREARAAALVAGLRPLPFQSGVLIGIGGQPVLLEVFDSPRTLADVWDALLQAVALDAVTAPAIPTPGRRARRFTGRVAAIDTVRGIDESGTVHEQGESPYARVTTLRWRDRAVHTSAVSVRHELVTA